MALVDDLLGFAPPPDQAEKDIASGGLPPEGLHHARLDGVREVTANTGSSGRELELKLLVHGGTVKETLWISDNEKARTRQVIFAHRLGLLKKVQVNGQNAYAKVDGKYDLTNCLGAECIVEIKHEEDTFNDKKSGKPRTITKAVLSFEGVYTLDDPRVKSVPRAIAGSVPPPKPQAKNDDFGGIV